MDDSTPIYLSNGHMSCECVHCVHSDGHNGHVQCKHCVHLSKWTELPKQKICNGRPLCPLNCPLDMSNGQLCPLCPLDTIHKPTRTFTYFLLIIFCYLYISVDNLKITKDYHWLKINRSNFLSEIHNCHTQTSYLLSINIIDREANWNCMLGTDAMGKYGSCILFYFDL